jgi:beta-galactosidase
MIPFEDPVAHAREGLMLKLFPVVLFLALVSTQDGVAEAPLIGAQVIIEPGQTPEEIDTWFRVMKDNGLGACRIRTFEMQMHRPDGTWDFSLFDLAFRAAEKYGIRVFATIFPASENNSVGGFKFPESDKHFKEIAACIQTMVTHFKQFPSLYAWVLLNEPGSGGRLPNTDFTLKKFQEWKAKQAPAEYRSKGYPLLVSFDREQFLLDYNTWYLEWIAAEIRKYDPGRHVHVNNHQIFQNAAEYDFSRWRNFLTTLGASAHPSWHFGYFKRSQYAEAMSANCEIIRSGAGPIPFWVTELQGGNNTYSGSRAFCPTGEEITQWLWTSIGAGAQGIIFWCLNPRSIGEEAGEWALLDFQNQPSDRLVAARDVSRCLAANRGLFSAARPIESPIAILYVREAMWAESKVQLSGPGDERDYEGRMRGGVIKSALACHETLAENGIESRLMEIDEFDWSRGDYNGLTVLLANQVAIPSRYWTRLHAFVERGGKLIVEGLTAFYDENMLSLMNTGFPLERLLGGTLSEVKCIPGDFRLPLGASGRTLPTHLWKSYIHNVAGTPLATDGKEVLATRNHFGKGETVWVPSLVALGARRTDNATFSSFLRSELGRSTDALPVMFIAHQKGLLMRTMQSGKTLITILVNKSNAVGSIELEMRERMKPSLLFAGKSGTVKEKDVTIAPEESMVIRWDPE